MEKADYSWVLKWIGGTLGVVVVATFCLWAGWKVRDGEARVEREELIVRLRTCETTSEKLRVALEQEKYVVRVWDGLASWYGPGFHGRPTSNGETFDENAPTAAHRNLAPGTILAIENLENGRWAITRINDWGPNERFDPPREIDVSKEIARRLEMVEAGVVKVRLYEIRPGQRKK